MRATSIVSCSLAFAVGTVLFGGCGPSKPVVIKYDRQAQYDISLKVKKVAIAEFGGHSQEDQSWGDAAADILASAMDVYNRKFNRYELVDRKRLKAILDEQDLQISISDPASAGKVGKLAHVDAMIYGNVKVNCKTEKVMRPKFNPVTQSMDTVQGLKRTCSAVVNFTMDDVMTSKTIATVTTSRSYDSDKDAAKNGGAGGALMKAVGVGGDNLPPEDEITKKLIDQCVHEFLSKISPHEEEYEVLLEPGKSKEVDTGNKMAMEDEYDEAIKLYQQAVELKPDDAGAVFNIGVMYEAKKDLPKALENYEQALKLKAGEKKFIVCRKRVRAEIAAAGETPASNESASKASK